MGFITGISVVQKIMQLPNVISILGSHYNSDGVHRKNPLLTVPRPHYLPGQITN